MRFKDVFEHAYQGTNCALICLAEFIMRLSEMLCVCVIYLTVPVWFIPYSIVKERVTKMKDNMSEQDYEMQQLLDGKSRMEIDEILGGMENGKF